MFHVRILAIFLSICSIGSCKNLIREEDLHQVKQEASDNGRGAISGTGFWDPLGLPKRFDARDKWTMCPSIGRVYDQGNCKSSYAISVASAVADRICIHSQGAQTPTISAQQIVSCCYLCGEGCRGGDHWEAWYFYNRHGLVSGGYESDEGCQPYTIEPCQHVQDSAVENSCVNKKSFTPKCKTSCYNPTHGTRYRKDNHIGSFYRIQSYEAMRELYDNGPITASFFMYKDFISYKSGVYRYNYTTESSYAGKQAVKILGWGEDTDGTPYWLAANSYGTDWGEDGFFKIIRGVNECYIEEEMYAGMPL